MLSDNREKGGRTYYNRPPAVNTAAVLTAAVRQVVPRRISVTGRVVRFGTISFLSARAIIWTASSAISRTGCLMVVMPGVVREAMLLSSKPISFIFSGIRIPFLLQIWITWAAMTSLLAKIPSISGYSVRIFSIYV